MAKAGKEVRAYLSQLGKRGGKRKLETLTPAQRTEIARRAANARWSKQKNKS